MQPLGVAIDHPIRTAPKPGCHLQRALEDGLFSFEAEAGQEDEAGSRTPDMRAVLAAGCQLCSAMVSASRGCV